MIDDELEEGLPYFLEKLKLGEDADGRAIRRAYAREVKLLDQEHQAAEFQWLRECFETAMHWAAHQEWLKAHPAGGDDGEGGNDQPPATAGPVRDAPPAAMLLAPQPPPDDEASDPVALATLASEGEIVPEAAAAPPLDEEAVSPATLAMTVFKRLMSIGERHGEPGELDEVATWEAEIGRRLDDEELLNLSARALFEAMIAQTLAFDFVEGHYALFLAAAEVFDWAHDRRRLYGLGDSGTTVNKALEERTIFHTQDEPDIIDQSGVLYRLRREAPPTDVKRIGDVRTFEKMSAQFPHLMAMCAPSSQIEQWRDGCRALRAIHADAAYYGGGSYAHSLSAETFSPGTVLRFAILAVLFLAFAFFNAPESSAPPVAQYAPPGSLAARFRDRDPLANAVKNGSQGGAPFGLPAMPRAPQVTEVDINYTPAQDSPLGRRVATVEITFGPDGNIAGAEIVSPSVDPAFDQALVAAALQLQIQTTWRFGKLRFTQSYSGQR